MSVEALRNENQPGFVMVNLEIWQLPQLLATTLATVTQQALSTPTDIIRHANPEGSET